MLEGLPLIGGFAIFIRGPWYLRIWPFNLCRKARKGENIFVIIDNFTIDEELLNILKRGNISLKIYRPRKAYSGAETGQLCTILLEQFYSRTKDTGRGLSPMEFATIANQVRPNTFTRVSSIKDLFNNRYYAKVM